VSSAQLAEHERELVQHLAGEEAEPEGTHTHARGEENAAMDVVLMSDTHVPVRAKDLPAQLWAAVDRADLVIHAGDWVDAGLLDRLEQRSRRLLACWGNNDGAELRRRLPEVARAEVDGLRIAVVHETGPAQGREQRCQAAYPDVDLLCFGHSHIPWDGTADHGLRLLNPGSPTDRRRQPDATYLTFSITEGVVEDVQLHRLPRAAGRA
jgi:putative phosphoesterase